MTRSLYTPLLCLLLTVFGSLRGQTVPSGGTALFTGSPPSAFGLRGDTANAAVSVVAVTGQTFSQAWKLETKSNQANAWNIELAAKINVPVVKGGVGLLHFWVRTTLITDPLAVGHLMLVVQKAGPNYDKSLFKDVNVSGQWAEIFMPFEMGAAYAANGAEICLDVGYKIQTLEIGGFEAIYYGTSLTLAQLPVTKIRYPGEEDGAAWRIAALERIETLRKGDFRIHVADAAGNPLANQPVHVEMLKHAFPFGTPISFQFLNTDNAANRMYQRKYQELFNAGSSGNDLKWPPWVGDWGPSMNHAQAFYGIKWMHDRGIPLRGHVLVWPGWENLPNSLHSLAGTAQQSTIPQRVLDHIKEMTDFTRGYTQEWDVINEPYTNHDLMDLFGDAIMLDWFNAAHAALPDNKLYLNDWNNHDDTADPAHVQKDVDIVTYLKAHGAPIDGLGIQAHFGGNPNAPVNILNTFDRLAALGVELRVTEFDVNTKDTALQADFTRDFLILSFSHPAMTGIQFWGFWETDHWLPDSALYTANFTEKPNAVAYKSLVLDQWWTRFDAVTDADGNLEGRGFYGDYRVSLTSNGTISEKTFKVAAGQPKPNVTLSQKAPRLINISTRSFVGETEGPAIAGLVIQGSEPKKVVVRAVGPTLDVFKISQFLPHPTLTLYNAAQEALVSNTGWDVGTDAAAVTQAFRDAGTFVFDTGSGDSAIVTTLAPGNYTAVVTGASGEKGVVLVEAYEVGAGESRLANLSNRSYVGTGEKVAISGLTVTGENARTFLIRGVGPGLAPFKVPNVLARPSISVYAGDKPIAGNAIWSTHPYPENITALTATVGAFGLAADSTDAALKVTLEPGQYTIITSGSDGGTGTCLVEVYEVK